MISLKILQMCYDFLKNIIDMLRISRKIQARYDFFEKCQKCYEFLKNYFKIFLELIAIKNFMTIKFLENVNEVVFSAKSFL